MGKLSSKMPKPREATAAQVTAGIKVIRRILWDMRWHDQGGYVCRNADGTWMSVGHGLGAVDNDEIAALFNMAGFQPDAIDPIGSCSDCKHAEVMPDGTRQGRGWGSPCLGCKTPRMTLFEPLKKPAKHARGASKPRGKK